jgi:predicted regulator of Ras-like GTPase activity (Roadblock/LC7/MglB family)
LIAAMFNELLKDLIARTDGALAALVMGFDGIAVDSFIADSDAPVEVENVGMEYSVILKEIKRAAELLDAGSAREVSIQAEKMTTVIRMINDDYFVAVALRPDGNYGKARFLLRTNAPKLASELGG